MSVAFAWVATARADELTGSVSLAWDSNPETNIAGYRVKYGTSSDALTQTQTSGSASTTTRISGLETGKTYYFAVQAYNLSGVDGPLSEQVSSFVEIPTVAEISIERSPATILIDGQAAGTAGNVTTGTSGSPQTYVVRNVGTAALTGLAMTLDGANPSEFSIATDLPLTTSTVVNGDFESSFSGWTSSGSVRAITYSTGGSGIAEFNFANNTPDGTISQSFGTLPGTTYTLAFQVGVRSYNTNQQSLATHVAGSGNLLSKIITVTGADDGSIRWTSQSFTFVANSAVTTLSFTDVSATTAATDLLLDYVRVTSLASSPAAIASLAPGASSVFTLTFKPSSAGEKTAAIHVASNDADENPFDLTLAGNGVNKADNPGLPEIAVSRSNGTELTDGTASVAFGTFYPGSSDGVETFTIRNTGTGVLKNLSATIDGVDAASFAVDLLTKDTLAVGESTTVRVTFLPTLSGPHAAVLHITSNDADEASFDIAISGSGTASPEIVVEDSSTGELFNGSSTLNFINTVPGSQSTPRTFTIRNTGQAALTGLSVSISGANASEFIASTPGATLLGPSASTTFQIVFVPGGSGSRSAIVHVASNDSDENSFDIALTGNGVTFPEIAINGPDGDQLANSDSIVDFPVTPIGASSGAQTITVRNLGTATLTDLSIYLGGDHASDFILENQLSGSLEPGASTNVRVSFRPTAAGARRAAVLVTSNDTDENPFTISFSGTAVSLPEIAVERSGGESLTQTVSTLTFGNADTGSFSAGQIITIRNDGTAPLTSISVSITGGNSSNFLLDGTIPTALAPGAGTSFTVFFKPATAGASTASLVITSNDADEASFTASLTGNGVAVPEIGVERSTGEPIADGAASLAFGSANIGSTSTASVMILRNSGTAPLSQLAVSVTGENASNFTVEGPAVTTLSPGAATSFKVYFKPSAAGTRGATLQITSNDADESPFTIALTGNGVAVPEIAVERANGVPLADAATTVGFSAVVLGSTSAAETLVIRNTGTAALINIALTTAGGHAADFIVDGPGVTSLAAGASASFKILFKPTAAGARSAAIRIASNDADENPFDIPLSGNGVALPRLAVATATGVPLSENPATADFENTRLATRSSARTFSISNTGTAALANLKLSVDGPQAADFLLESTAATSLLPGASTTFKVTFKPLAAGSRNAALHITSNDPDANPFDIFLAGTGIALPKLELYRNGGPVPDGNETLAFGSVPLGSVSGPETLTVHNSGTALLTDLAAAVDGIFGADFLISGLETASLAPGSSTTFRISFSPTAAGSRTGGLLVSSNDTQTGTFRLALTGTGVAFPVITLENPDGAALAPGATPRRFDSVIVGATGSPQTFRVRNAGTAPLSGLKISTFGSGEASFIPTAPGVDSLAPGASTAFTIAFRPTAGGTRTAGLRISYSELPAAPFEILLTGDGITLPGIELRKADGAALTGESVENFGSLDLIAAPRSRTYTIANTGTAPLTGITLLRDGPQAADFAISNLGATTLAPGAQTSFTLLFKPTATGTRNATLLIRSNAGETPLLLTLTGKAVSTPEIRILQAAKDLKSGSAFINFGSSQTAVRGDVRTFTLSNIGSAPLTRISLTKNGTHPADFIVSTLKTDTLAPGASTTFTVTFKPTDLGIRWGAIHLLSSDADEKSFDIVLTGKGTAKSTNKITKAVTHAPTAAVSPPPVKGIAVIDGRKYLTLTVTQNPATPVTSARIQVSGDLLDWYSGPRHTTVLRATATTLTVRDNTPLAPGTKRHIRLK